MVRIVGDAHARRRPISICFIRTNLFQGCLSLSSQLSNNVIKGFLDIDAVLSGCLDEFAAEVFGQCMPFLRGHFTFVLLIAFVPDQHDWNRTSVGRLTTHLCGQVAGACRGVRVSRFLDSLYLGIKFLDPGEGVPGGYTVD